MPFECIKCEENCHLIEIPWFGNKCILGRARDNCFREYTETRG